MSMHFTQVLCINIITSLINNKSRSHYKIKVNRGKVNDSFFLNDTYWEHIYLVTEGKPFHIQVLSLETTLINGLHVPWSKPTTSGEIWAQWGWLNTTVLAEKYTCCHTGISWWLEVHNVREILILSECLNS